MGLQFQCTKSTVDPVKYIIQKYIKCTPKEDRKERGLRNVQFQNMAMACSIDLFIFLYQWY